MKKRKSNKLDYQLRGKLNKLHKKSIESIVSKCLNEQLNYLIVQIVHEFGSRYDKEH